jgi:hypothetical protein
VKVEVGTTTEAAHMHLPQRAVAVAQGVHEARHCTGESCMCAHIHYSRYWLGGSSVHWVAVACTETGTAAGTSWEAGVYAKGAPRWAAAGQAGL